MLGDQVQGQFQIAKFLFGIEHVESRTGPGHQALHQGAQYDSVLQALREGGRQAGSWDTGFQPRQQVPLRGRANGKSHKRANGN